MLEPAPPAARGDDGGVVQVRGSGRRVENRSTRAHADGGSAREMVELRLRGAVEPVERGVGAEHGLMQAPQAG